MLLLANSLAFFLKDYNDFRSGAYSEVSQWNRDTWCIGNSVYCEGKADKDTRGD